MKKLWDDPLVVPATGESPAEALARASEVDDPLCAAYLARRRIPLAVAREAGIRFAPRFDGRPAILAPMRHPDGGLRAVTARYLKTVRREEKILTVGVAGGVFAVRGGLATDPLFLVEGVFDALTVALCGVASVATIGRYVDWMPELAAGRAVLLAFDGNKVGDSAARYYTERMPRSACRRLRPPPGCKDWSSALAKRGLAAVTDWLARSDSAPGGPGRPGTPRTVEPTCAS